MAPHYLAEPYSPALKPDSESEAFFCHISWRQTHGGHTRAKRVKKATPRYVAGLLAPLCCVYCDFGGIRAILSGGNPPGFKTNHTLMLYISFGEDEFPSGHVLIPALPYFIGVFLGEKEQLNTPYQGKYFHEGGRFVCLGHPQPYETVRSEFGLRTAFQSYFDQADVPMISGIGLGVDTFASGEGGTAAAYIHRIEFLE